MIDKPLYGNPLAGGSGQLGGLILPPKQEAPPLAEVYTNPATKQLLDDFGKSDFAKNVNHMQQDHMEIDLNGLPISGNGSYIGSLMQYLKSVGKDNMVSDKNLQKFEPLAQVPGQELLGNSDPYTVNYGGMDIGPNVGNEIAVPDNFPGNPNRKPADPANLGSAGGPSLFPNKIGGIENTAIASLPDNNYTRSVQPIVSGPETFEIATQQAPMDPYNRVGQQLTGPNQDDILGTLKNIEQGIASLGQGGMDQSSFGGFNNNFGIGSFFPPYGGMYGK